MAATSALVDNATRTGSSGTTSTISSAAFGAAAPDRVLLSAALASGFSGISSATIGGETAAGTPTIDGLSAVELLRALVASGTSGNIVGTFPFSDALVSFGVVAVSGAASATPTDTIDNGSGGSGTIDVPAGGCIVAYALSSTSAGSWTGASAVRTDTTTIPGIIASIATFDNAGGAITGRSVSYSTGDALFVVAFDAAAGGSPYSVAANGGTYSLTGASVVTAIKPDWTFVGKSDVAVDASGDYTLSEPTGAQQDDILVVDIAIRSNVLHTNADWTFPQSDASGNTTNNTTGSIVSYQTGYCIRGSSPPSYVFAKTGGSRCLATVRAYRSSRAGTPVFDTSAEVAMGAASGTVTLTGGVTTAEPGELLVTGVFGARANTVSNMDGTTEVTGNSGSTDTTTPPTRGTWIERSDRNNGTSPTVALACYDTIKPTAGSTGDLTATESQSARHGMTVMAFKHPPGTSNKTIAADGGSYALTGATVATKLGRKVAASGGSYALTGSAVTLRRNLPVVVGSGSYSLTGASVTLREDRKVSALGGTYALTGAAVTVRHGYSVSVAAGSYALTGAAVPLFKTWRLDATGGSYALSGSAVTLRYGYAVGAGSGSYAISGASVALKHGYAVSVGGGSYALNGTSVPLLKTWRLDATSGTYALTGADVTLTKTTLGAFVVAADGGSYSINGSAVPLVHNWRISAEAGSYTITGASVALTQSTAPEPPTTARGGASYLTREEMRELAKRQRKKDKEERDFDKALTETIREAYQDSVNPEAKIERLRALEEDDDEEALITMILHHFNEARA